MSFLIGYGLAHHTCGIYRKGTLIQWEQMLHLAENGLGQWEMRGLLSLAETLITWSEQCKERGPWSNESRCYILLQMVLVNERWEVCSHWLKPWSHDLGLYIDNWFWSFFLRSRQVYANTNSFNTLRLLDTHMYQCTGSSLVQLMTYHLFSDKPWP